MARIDAFYWAIYIYMRVFVHSDGIYYSVLISRTHTHFLYDSFILIHYVLLSPFFFKQNILIQDQILQELRARLSYFTM